MARYDLKYPIDLPGGGTVRAVVMRRPIRADKAAILARINEENARRDRPLSPAAMCLIMIAQVIDVPLEAVRKFHVRDVQALNDEATAAFAREGMA